MQTIEDIINSLLMFLVFMASFACLIFGVLKINEATFGVGFICAAIYCLVVLRIMQASVSQAKLTKAINALATKKEG